MNTTFRRQGDPVQCGWSIGRAPLALRGIRFADGEDGAAPPAGGGQAPTGQAPAAQGASPTDVAAMLATLGKATPPAPQAPAQPAAPQQIQGFTPEQVQKLMADNAAAQKALDDAQTAAQQAQKERDEFQAQLAGFQREKAVTTAADGKANAALLLDSAKFQAAVKDIDLTDTAALTAEVEAFVKDNPAYAAAPAGPQLPNTSGGTPAGGTTTKPTDIDGAVAAAMSA
ncbi:MULTISPECIES: hypothetical protein [unclassified Leucobacter]|uniref:hypothetical protein n=1 Tax=unclassified Leucobacter TaxID=2621730 RepID=UPI00301B1EEB